MTARPLTPAERTSNARRVLHLFSVSAICFAGVAHSSGAQVTPRIHPATVTFNAGGGHSSAFAGQALYAFSMIPAGGAIHSSTGLFTPPLGPRSAVIKVVDTKRQKAREAVTILQDESVSVNPTSVQPGQSVTVTFANSDDGPSPEDWIGLFTPTASVDEETDWRYLNGSQTSPATSITAGSFQFPMPTTPGDYELRLIRDDINACDCRTVMARSATITVGNATPEATLRIDPASVTLKVGAQQAFSASGGTPPYVFSIVSGGGAINSSTGVFTAPSAPGSAVIQVNDTRNHSDRATVTIIEDVQAQIVSVSVDKTSIQPGQSVTARFTNGNVGQAPDADWIGLFTPTASVDDELDWLYLNGSKTSPATVITSGSFEFPMPTTPGTYELRFVRDDINGCDCRTVLARSATITVVNSTPTVAGPRQQVLLNGTWSFTPAGGSTTTIAVPEFWDAAPGFRVSSARYERQVTVPSEWSGKRVKIEFQSVHHVADVYVNGQYVGGHTGMDTPFAFDISNLVSAGQTFTLRVDVKGGYGLSWPLGWYGWLQQWGIGDDVYLRAYGTPAIADAFIQTSFRQGALSVQYTLQNSSNVTRTVTVMADAVRGSVVEKSFTGPVVSLSPGETRTVTLSGAWPNPALWMPDSPNLYFLQSRLVENGVIVDAESRRFGFREVWINGSQFMLNGIPANLIGTSFVSQAQGFNGSRYNWMTRATWPTTVGRLKSINVNILRFHQQPPPSWVFDVTDELGLLVIAETPVYARGDEGYPIDRNLYVQNSQTWISEWIPFLRNHPSIFMWSAENEMLNPFGILSASQIRSLGDQIRQYDVTRPVTYDSEGDAIGDAVVNYHYPEGYGQSPSGSIYSWSRLLVPGKPTGVGEFFTHYGDNGGANIWWQGTWTRGMRYVGLTDIRPYTLEWALSDPTSAPAANVSNGFNPVALFDKAYDDLGIDPIANSVYPSVDEGVVANRTLVLYNDDWRETTITVSVQIMSGTTVYATGQRTYTVPLGGHLEIPYSFQVPYVGGAAIDVVLTTSKAGSQRFSEAKHFNVRDLGANGTSSSIVTLN